MTDAQTGAKARLSEFSRFIAEGQVIPYLGPGVLELTPGGAPVPAASLDLSAALTAKVGVPGRIRNNLWASAQYIETHRHRVTLERMMADVFSVETPPTALHRWLAGLTALPAIVDTWYDDAMARALTQAGRADWGQVQGAHRGNLPPENWCNWFDPAGAKVDGPSGAWSTILYKPHGCVWPAKDFLVSDSDYVEVLTEIDIQTPIPEQIRDMRGSRGFLFLGCRFYDQMLRTFARQITKRSDGPLVAVIEGDLAKNEEKFLEECGIERIDLPLPEVEKALIGELAAS